MKVVKVINKSQNELPKYQTKDSAGMDVRADLSTIARDPGKLSGHKCAYDEVGNYIMIWPGGRALIPTELYFEIPEGYEIQVRPRSGLALKAGITVLNSPGCVDSDFRGSVGVILINHSDEPFCVEQGDRIAQIVLNKVEEMELVPVEEISKTERGEGSFNSTGIK